MSTTMKLYYAPTSPFVRKVLICAHLKNIIDQIEIVTADSADTNGAHNDVNPLGKIPALLLKDGNALFDSRVICDYLDTLSATPKLFPDGAARWSVLTQGALADGIADAMLLTVFEKRLRPEAARHQPWVDRQNGKITRALSHLEANIECLDGPVNYGHVATACALGYLDLRGDGSWRQAAPQLVAWLDRFAAAVPSFETTRPPAA